MFILASSGDILGNFGSLLGGISGLVAALGALVGFVIRARKTARTNRLRTERAASVAAAEAKRVLEERLERQHQSQLEGYKQQLEAQKESYENQLEEQRHSFDLHLRGKDQQISDLTRDRQELLARLLDTRNRTNG